MNESIHEDGGHGAAHKSGLLTDGQKPKYWPLISVSDYGHASSKHECISVGDIRVEDTTARAVLRV